MKKEEQIKTLQHLRESALMQLKTVEESEQEIMGKVSNLEIQLEHAKKNNTGLMIGDVSVEEFLELQVKFEKQHLDNFIEEKKEQVQFYECQLQIIDSTLKQLINL